MGEILDRFTGNISPVALLVSSFFWSWFDVVPFSPALFSAAGKPIDALPFVVSFGASALLLAVLAASTRRVRGCSIQGVRRLFLLLWQLGLAAHLCRYPCEPCVAGGRRHTGGFVPERRSVLAGGIATCQGTTNALVHLAAALPLNIVAILLVMFLRPTASMVFAVLLPLFSALCYAVYLVRGQNRATLQTVTVVREKCVDGVRRARRLFGCDRYFLLMVLAISASFGFANYQAMFTPGMQGAYVEYVTVRCERSPASRCWQVTYSARGGLIIFCGSRSWPCRWGLSVAVRSR